jgi:hypothetical protein
MIAPSSLRRLACLLVLLLPAGCGRREAEPPPADAGRGGQPSPQDAGDRWPFLAGPVEQLAPSERRSLLTLWSISCTNPATGGRLAANDEAALARLANDEVLAVKSRSVNNRELRAAGDRVVWVADDPASDAVYAAFFNKGAEGTRLVVLHMEDVGLPPRVQARDLWRRSDVGEFVGTISVEVEPHGAVLLKLWPAEG